MSTKGKNWIYDKGLRKGHTWTPLPGWERRASQNWHSAQVQAEMTKHMTKYFSNQCDKLCQIKLGHNCLPKNYSVMLGKPRG